MKESKFGFICKNYLLLCLINFLMNFGQQMANTTVPRFVNYLGSSATLVGFVTGAFSMSSICCKPFAGPMIDALDKKKLLLFGIGAISVAFLGYGFSTNTVMVIVFRMLHGCGVAFTVVPCLTMVSSVVEKQYLTSAIAYYTIAQSVAQAIGPAVGLSLIDSVGYRNTFLIGMVFMILSALMVFVLSIEKQEKKKLVFNLESMVAKEALAPSMINLFLGMVFVNQSAYLTLHADKVGVGNIGLFFTVNAIALLFSRPIVASLSEKLGITKVLSVAIIMFGLSFVVISYATNLSLFLVAAVVSAFGYGAASPLIQSLCIKSVEPSRRGSASNTSYYGIDIGYITGPLIAGKIVDSGLGQNYALMFRYIPLVLVFALLIIFINKKKFDEIGNR